MKTFQFWVENLPVMSVEIYLTKSAVQSFWKGNNHLMMSMLRQSQHYHLKFQLDKMNNKDKAAVLCSGSYRKLRVEVTFVQ